jgi:copper homeostasis protein
LNIDVEVVACSVEDCRRAEAAGADRIELCSAIELGGLTPSLGLYLACRAVCSLPITVMLRPRAGGFVYSPSERAVILADIESFRAVGVQDFAFGALVGGRIDRSLAGAIGGTFHRAMDSLDDREAALEELIELGYSRVLTSGGASTAMQGTEEIRRLVERAVDRITVVAAGGIRPENVSDLLESTRCRAVHLGPFLGAGAEYQGQKALHLDENVVKQLVPRVKVDRRVKG